MLIVKFHFVGKFREVFCRRIKIELNLDIFTEGVLRRNTRTAKTADIKTKLEIRSYLSEEAEWWSALRPAHNR